MGHWSLAIVTNPGHLEPLQIEKASALQTTYDFCKNALFSIISHSVCNEPKWVNTLETNAKILAIAKYPKKILHFDSMRGCHPTNDIYKKLRIYLGDEWRRQYKKEEEIVFDVETIPGVSLGVPQQTNSCDCGVYVLHFAQLFALNPFYNSGNCISRNDWFSSRDIEQKRNDIKALCIQMRQEQGKNYLDIDRILIDQHITVQSQSGKYSHYEHHVEDEDEDEYEYEEGDDEEAERIDFEERLWEMEEDLLKDRLITCCKYDPALYDSLKSILDGVEEEEQQQQANGHTNSY